MSHHEHLNMDYRHIMVVFKETDQVGYINLLWSCLHGRMLLQVDPYSNKSSYTGQLKVSGLPDVNLSTLY